jgi:hypothetical protein
MFKLLIASVVAALFLSACGGGGSAPAVAPVANTMKLSFYGNPLQSNPNAPVAHFAVAHASAATDSAASDAAAQTVSDLTAALAAQGVTANVTAQVMDGTTLHQLIQATNNGVGPTNDQLTVDPSEWLIANFTLDDMVTDPADPVQAAAIAQFQADLVVFVNRAHLAGKQTFIVVPFFTCDASLEHTAAWGLHEAELNASNAAFALDAGAMPTMSAALVDGATPNAVAVSHMGADCRTPDAYLQNLRTQAVALDIATRLKLPS